MARTTNSDVSEILDTSLGTAALDAWIEIANTLVDDVAAADTSLTSTRLTQLETLVAAHLASTQDQRAASRSGASRSVTYQGETGMGFEATKYGQQALALDPTGTLAGSTKPTASISAPDAKGIND